MADTARIIYPTANGERCIPVKLPLRDRGEQIVRAAEGDGCTNTAAVRAQIAQLETD
jgi:hypothetical protein